MHQKLHEHYTGSECQIVGKLVSLGISCNTSSKVWKEKNIVDSVKTDVYLAFTSLLDVLYDQKKGVIRILWEAIFIRILS